MISITSDQFFIVIDIADLKDKAQKLISVLGYENFDLGILLTELKTMHELNKKYRNIDKPTDIVSFPYHTHLKAGEKIIPTSEDEKNLGDIVLCPEYIKQDLERWNQTFEQRMDVLLVHGILHMLGYDHIKNKDYKIMKAEENRLLKYLYEG